MEKTIEKPSSIVGSGDHDSIVQRTQAPVCRQESYSDETQRNSFSPTAGNALLVAVDSSHEED